MFRISGHDDRISLDVHLPIDSLDQIEQLIEISGDMLSEFKEELISDPAPEIHLRNRRTISLETHDGRLGTEYLVSSDLYLFLEQ